MMAAEKVAAVSDEKNHPDSATISDSDSHDLRDSRWIEVLPTRSLLLREYIDEVALRR
jgi:hypothetical protein